MKQTPTDLVLQSLWSSRYCYFSICGLLSLFRSTCSHVLTFLFLSHTMEPGTWDEGSMQHLLDVSIFNDLYISSSEKPCCQFAEIDHKGQLLSHLLNYPPLLCWELLISFHIVYWKIGTMFFNSLLLSCVRFFEGKPIYRWNREGISLITSSVLTLTADDRICFVKLFIFWKKNPNLIKMPEAIQYKLKSYTTQWNMKHIIRLEGGRKKWHYEFQYLLNKIIRNFLNRTLEHTA